MFKEGDKVRLKDRQRCWDKGKITKVYPDGTFLVEVVEVTSVLANANTMELLESSCNVVCCKQGGG